MNFRSAPRNQSALTGCDDIVCQCNAEAVLLTVRKEGNNQGNSAFNNSIFQTKNALLII